MSQVPNPDAPTLWQATLSDLSLQMTKATFEQWLKGTTARRDNGRWQVVAANDIALAWLEHRLRPLVERTLAGVVGEPVEVDFVVDSGASPKPSAPPAPPKPDPLPTPTEAEELEDYFMTIDFYAAKRDMGYWLPEFNYDRFWMIYLGNAYHLWRYLIELFTRKCRNKAQLDLGKPANQGWTPPFRLSYRRATEWLGKTNSAVVPGGVYECHNSLAHFQAGKQFEIPPFEECCGAYTPNEWRPQEAGGGRCYYWRPGLLHTLYDEGLLAIEISATNRARVQVLRVLPLLTPWQIERGIPDYLHEAHDKWLNLFAHHFGLDLEQWSRISLERPRLRPDEIVLHGRPPPNPFVDINGE